MYIPCDIVAVGEGWEWVRGEWWKSQGCVGVGGVGGKKGEG